MPLAPESLLAPITASWDRDIQPTLVDDMRTPNKFPRFHPDWAANGRVDAARKLAVAELARDLCLPGLTPLTLIEVPGALDEMVLIYGHLDRQPEMVG